MNGLNFIPVLILIISPIIYGQDGMFDKSRYTGDGETPKYWNKMAFDDLQRALSMKTITNKAKNVILFLGDGMGVSTLTPARILKGQLQNKSGEEELLSWDLFPHAAFSKTYNQDHQTPDSAGTSTAFLTGVKTNKGVIGVDARAKRGDCKSAQGAELYSIGKWSLEKGKKVGFVTTARITHATPAGLYAHIPERDWEGYVPDSEAECKDIASQLVDDNKDISVIMGGGRRSFLPRTANDYERGSNYKHGRRDGRNLIEAWQAEKESRNLAYSFVWNSTEFHKVDHRTTDYLLGLFESSHMQYEADRLDSTKETAGEPSLAEMTEKAIRILRKDPDGFFLLVEGGRIDHGHHATNAHRALHDTLAMEEAVAKAVELTSEMDTLIVVTADHSHAFAMGGYPSRGNPILGLTDDKGAIALDGQKNTYTTLNYGNGPGYRGVRRNVTTEQAQDKNYRQDTALPLSSETHGGEDVAIFARGPWSHLFHGVHQQNYIAHVMAFASCVGQYKNEECVASFGGSRSEDNSDPSNDASSVFTSVTLPFFAMFTLFSCLRQFV